MVTQDSFPRLRSGFAVCDVEEKGAKVKVCFNVSMLFVISAENCRKGFICKGRSFQWRGYGRSEWEFNSLDRRQLACEALFQVIWKCIGLDPGGSGGGVGLNPLAQGHFEVGGPLAIIGDGGSPFNGSFGIVIGQRVGERAHGLVANGSFFEGLEPIGRASGIGLAPLLGEGGVSLLLDLFWKIAGPFCRGGWIGRGPLDRCSNNPFWNLQMTSPPCA